MGATQDFNKPAFSNALDADLDAIRDNWHFLSMVCAGGAVVLPGWQTSVSATDYAEPDTITLTRGTKRIIIDYTWNADSSVNTIQFSYDDGVSSPGLTTWDALTINYDDDGNVTGAEPPVDLLTNLVAWWSMDETSSTRADSHGSLDLTDATTTSYTTGKVGNAATFSSDYLYNHSASALAGNQDFTITFWMNGNTPQPSSISMIAAAHNGTWSAAGCDWRIYCTSTADRVYAAVSNGSDINTANYVSFDAGSWNFICVQYNATTKQLSISKDNGTPTTDTLSGTANSVATRLWIGRWNAAGFSFSGELDEFNFYNTLLDSDQITALYNAGSGKAYADL